MEQQVSEPTEEDIEGFARQVVVVDELATEHLGRGLANDDTDLDAIQDLLDASALKADQTYELQCLGIVFGRRFVVALGGVDWVFVEDEYGRDPALRYLKTSLIFFPLTMISKRVEAGESPSRSAIFSRASAPRSISYEANSVRTEHSRSYRRVGFFGIRASPEAVG